MITFSPAYASPSGSPIRELHKYIGLPGMISLAAGYPDSAMFDADGIRSAMGRAYSNYRRCLQYTGTEGLPELRCVLIDLMKRRSVAVEPEQLVVTTGSQQGFDLVMRVLLGPGDAMLVEQPAYPATLQALRLHQAQIIGVPADEQGINTDALENILLQSKGERRLKALYTVPTFSNPTGATLPPERRMALLKLAVKYGFVIIEDDPYSELRFSENVAESLISLAKNVPGAQDYVVHLSSLSKVIAGGLRVGWLVGPEAIVKRCVIAKQTSDLCSSALTQAIAAEYLLSGDMDRHFPKVVESYRSKCSIMAGALDAAFGDRIHFRAPEGGMFIWAACEGIDSSALLERAIEHRVMFVPGNGFYLDSSAVAAFRLSFAGASAEDLSAGVQRLYQAYVSLQAH